MKDKIKVIASDGMIKIYKQAKNHKWVWKGSFTPFEYGNDELIKFLTNI